MPSSRSGVGFSLDLLDERPGFARFRLTGPARRLARFRANEGGGYRFQRVPPTEKRGRVHTSTLTVAVLSEPSRFELQLEERDLAWITKRGSGPGGQHRNKTETAVQLTHLPTGLKVEISSGRSLHQNKQLARALLGAKLLEAEQRRLTARRDRQRRRHTMASDRAEKRRTIRMQADQVVDHVTGKRMKASRYLRGEVDQLWP